MWGYKSKFMNVVYLEEIYFYRYDLVFKGEVVERKKILNRIYISFLFFK